MVDPIDFNNTEAAFGHRTTKELRQAKFLFGMLGHPWLLAMAQPVLELAFKIGLPVEGLIKKTVFYQFCGGEDLHDCQGSIEKLERHSGIKSVLDHSVEGADQESSFDWVLGTLLEVCAFSKDRRELPFMVFKPSALGSLELYHRASLDRPLDPGDTELWERTVQRYDTICGAVAATRDLRIMIDAEESWGHPAVDRLVEQMMVRYNRERAVVFTTVQLYIQDKYKYLSKVRDLAQRHGIKVGLKLVRGAYMEKEMDRAREMGYPNPICPDKAATDDNFDRGTAYVLDNLDCFELYLGTHNEQSCHAALDALLSQGLAPGDGRVWFGQLYGMGDNIGHNLAGGGYNVAKYLPFGPVREVMPYLIRRVRENASVGSQSSRELQLINRELVRRKLDQ